MKLEAIDVIKSIDPGSLRCTNKRSGSGSDFFYDENLNMWGSLHIMKAAGECNVKKDRLCLVSCLWKSRLSAC